MCRSVRASLAVFLHNKMASESSDSSSDDEVHFFKTTDDALKWVNDTTVTYVVGLRIAVMGW